MWKYWKRQIPSNIHKSNIPGTTRPSLHEYQALDESPKFYPSDDPNPSPETAMTLRDYQLEGVNWLLWNWWQRRPCILAVYTNSTNIIILMNIIIYYMYI